MNSEFKCLECVNFNSNIYLHESEPFFEKNLFYFRVGDKFQRSFVLVIFNDMSLILFHQHLRQCILKNGNGSNTRRIRIVLPFS